MKQLSLKLAILSTLGLVSAQAMATGLVAIPAAGFSGTAYTLCNTYGNFGSTYTSPPTSTGNNTCAVFPANDATSPVAGFTLIASYNRAATINNAYTNNTNVQVGTVSDRVWRNAAATECIYGTKFVPSNIDYLPSIAGTQYFEVNDIARSGFSNSGVVNAGYFSSPSYGGAVYRIGRSFTSVQHRASGPSAVQRINAGTNYSALPGLGSNASINGETTATYSTTAVTQTANINSNWVDFTVEVSWANEEGNFSAGASPMTYIQTTCTSAAPVAIANAIRLRQTGQELQPLIEISMPGYAPAGASALPSPVVPF